MSEDLAVSLNELAEKLQDVAAHSAAQGTPGDWLFELSVWVSHCSPVIERYARERGAPSVAGGRAIRNAYLQMGELTPENLVSLGVCIRDVVFSVLPPGDPDYPIPPFPTQTQTGPARAKVTR